MRNYISTDKGFIGFGETQRDADEDLYLNMCIADLANDTKKRFTRRREYLHPWLPRNNMLHICNLGCLVYQNGIITNTKDGKSIIVSQGKMSQFYYMANLFGDELSYEDIAIVMRPEIDEFFKNISRDFMSIKDMPVIKRLSSLNGFDPEIVVTFSDDILVGISKDSIGVKDYGEETFTVVELTPDIPKIPALSYVGYRKGIIFDEKGVYRCQRS